MNIDFSAFHTSSTTSAAVKYATPYKAVDGSDLSCLCVGNEYDIVKHHLGKLEQDSIVNFWTFGRYAMQDVLKYVLMQTGPADVTACTWAITKQSVETLLTLRDKGLLRSFKLWIDPRVKVRNPEPLQMLMLNFPLTISPVHAKVTCISNDDWHVSISGSLNFTSNPQPERGIICTIEHVWRSDLDILERQFSSTASVDQSAMVTSDDADTISTTATEAVPFYTSMPAEPRRAWGHSDTYTVPKCDLVEKIKYHQRNDFSIISAFERSEEGYELSQIKADMYNVGRFAESMTKIIDKLIGGANRDLYALVTPPKRRHTANNFAEACAVEIAKRARLHYYVDAVKALSKHRVGAEFELVADVQEPIVIIFDDIITTGSTLRSTGALFKDKSVIYIVGIYNS